MKKKFMQPVMVQLPAAIDESIESDEECQDSPKSIVK